MDAIYNCKRLDFHSDYSFITNKWYMSSLKQEINFPFYFLTYFVSEYLMQHIS